MASISLNFISTNRTALLLGDDSLMIYRVDAQGVGLRIDAGVVPRVGSLAPAAAAALRPLAL